MALRALQLPGRQLSPAAKRRRLGFGLCVFWGGCRYGKMADCVDVALGLQRPSKKARKYLIHLFITFPSENWKIMVHLGQQDKVISKELLIFPKVHYPKSLLSLPYCFTLKFLPGFTKQVDFLCFFALSAFQTPKKNKFVCFHFSL